MKTVKYIFAAACALLAAAACQKTGDAPEVTSEPVLRTFTCTIAGPESDDPTKVAIDAAGKTTWEVGDKILIHGKSTSENKVVTLTAGDLSVDFKKATFTVDLSGVTPYDPDQYYAAYPADAYIESSSGRGYYYNRFSDTNHPLMSAYLSGDSFVFHNLCGVITFAVSGSFDQYVFSGNNGETVGYDAYQVKIISNDSPNYKRSDGTSGPKTSISAPVVADGTTVNYIGLPNGASFSDGFTIKFLNGGAIVKQVSTNDAINVARGKLLPLGNVTSHLKDYVAPTNHDNSIGVDVATATDLGGTSDGTANCYIVYATGDYKFKAVKGNSTALVGTVDSVSILWETWNNAETVTTNSVIAAADYDQQTGEDAYIVFKMPATLHAGNAVIAAKDAGGNILWSWHIWVPSTTITSDTYGLFTTPAMDRNLGALVVATASSSAETPIESFGLLYQWGRKDPFPGPKAVKSSSAATVAGTARTVASGQMSIDETIAAPTKYAIYDSGVPNNDWNKTSDNDLWGNVSNAKTKYDPCPPGYKVPKRDASETFYHSKLIDGSTTATGWDYNSTYAWFTVGSPVTVFPLAGRISKSGSYDGHSYDRAFIWTSRKADDDASAVAQYVYYESGTAKSAYSWNQEKATGGSVRCVAE